jgi:hypothetical protein
MKSFSPPGGPSLKKPNLFQDGLVPVRQDKRKMNKIIRLWTVSTLSLLVFSALMGKET